jgi:hypothetical protein
MIAASVNSRLNRQRRLTDMKENDEKIQEKAIITSLEIEELEPKTAPLSFSFGA